METYRDGALTITKVASLGPYDNNAYIISGDGSGEALVVDMPAGSRAVLEALGGLQVKAILITHTHPDHWAEYELVKGATGAPVCCHPAERIMPAQKIDRPLKDGEELELGAVSVRAIHTPGHTPGSTCFLAGRFVLSGDTLFPGGPGRTQTPEDLQQTVRSIEERLYTLPEETMVLPGHGANTTIGESKKEYAVFVSKPQRPELCGDVLWAG